MSPRLSTGRGRSNGYLRIRLTKNKQWKDIMVHRLVAEVFVPNPENLPYVNHKDENKLNNVPSNLEWCTHEYNMNYGTRPERARKATCRPVLCVETGVVYESAIEAQKQTGIDDSNISTICKKVPKHKTAGGYHWEFVDKNNSEKS